MSDRESHNECTTRFIDLANQLAAEGKDPQLVSAALMAASGIYVTFVAAGNEGGLEEAGVEKVVDLYRRNLEHIQKRKREELEKGAGDAAENGD
ncbi:MAG: DUF3144 domain-containing protein [Xanthomonadales bacterium]|nr:DUF3144 domain-containing protein [Xanthomonadales bacterium]